MRTKPSSSTCWTMKPSSSMCAHSITVGAPSAPVRTKKWLPSGVGLVPVVVSGELGGDQVGDRRLVAGDAGDRIEAAEELGQVVRHGAYPTGLEGYRAAVQIDLPKPYDFHRSTFRFRTFGEDAASVWHDDGLYRVLRSGRVVRIAADGVRGDGPLAAADRGRGAARAGGGVRSGCVRRGPPADRRPRARVPAAARRRPVRVAGDVGDGAAGLAAGGVRHPQPVRAPLRPQGGARRRRGVGASRARRPSPAPTSRASASHGPRSARSRRWPRPTST